MWGRSTVTTDQGLRVKAALDENTYQPGINVSGADLAAIKLKRDEFHSEWNYRVMPRAIVKRGYVFKLFLDALDLPSRHRLNRTDHRAVARQ